MSKVIVIDVKRLGFFRRFWLQRNLNWEPKTTINFTEFDVICVIHGNTIYVCEIRPNALGARKALEAHGIQGQLPGSDTCKESGEVGQETQASYKPPEE